MNIYKVSMATDQGRSNIVPLRAKTFNDALDEALAHTIRFQRPNELVRQTIYRSIPNTAAHDIVHEEIYPDPAGT